MLKTLRNINTLLSIRLNLHEELPPQLRSFNIESGRVTFTVPDEFELDLSIADEDPSSQLFFIDFRFAFWPSSQETIDTRLLDDIDRKCNELLGTTGLRGCYQFLHEMVLTHKINILRRQAFEMSREWWSESIKLEMLRRTLVVQYWLGRVGPRHWIEIGISSGKRKTSRWTAGDEPTSEISVRWFVAGREVQDAPAIPLQLHHLSTERILKSYICTHITRILSSIRQRLLQIRSYGEHALAIELTTSETEPWDCQLKVELTASTSITVAVEPVSGKFALIPTSPLFARFEADMNNLRDPAADAHWLIFKLRCLSVINEVESSARAIGLQLWKTLSLKQDDFRRVFSRDTMRVLYLRRKEWNSEWILAMSVGPSGEAWWIMEMYGNNKDFS
jgi:mediator of RNA polymerase II transcription subunit 14